MADKLYSLVCYSYSEYSEREHNLRTAIQAVSDFPSVNNFVLDFFGGAGSAFISQRATSFSRLSIIQRVTIADALASIHASSSTRIAFAKLLERFSSASSASSSERLLASNRNSSCGRGMIFPLGMDLASAPTPAPIVYVAYMPRLSFAQAHYYLDTPSGESKA